MWRFIALFVALLAGVGAAIWYYRAPHPGAPVRIALHNNEDAWIENLQSRNPHDAEAATAAVEARGTAALPVIRRTLQDDGADPARRKAALKACAILGVRAAEAIPDIADLLPDEAYTAEAALALSFMGSAAVPTLRDAVDAEEAGVRKEALRSLGKIRERASIDPQLVIPVLLSAVDDPDAEVRAVAVRYLGIVRDSPAREVPALITALADDDANVRAAAASALAAYGHQAVSAVPALRKAAADKDQEVQREAGRALITISEKTPK